MTPTRETIERTIARYLRLPEEADDCADEVLRALDAAGLAVVPRDPTEAMKLEGARSIGQSMPWPNHTDRSDAAYRAMIAAAPDVVE
jgi:hypothetical protein